MSIETDESLWPEGAQFYGPETKYHNACFYKQDEDGHWWICFGTTVSAWSLTGPNVPSKRDDLIPRPIANQHDQGAPVQPWPKVGVECEYDSTGLGHWRPCKVIGRHECFVWLTTSNGPFTAPSGKIVFRPIRTLRDDLIKLLDGYDWLADAVLEKYELKEKTK